MESLLEIIQQNNPEIETQTSLWLSYPGFIEPYCNEKHTKNVIHILGGSTYAHWRCYFYDRANLYIYDSLGCKLYENLEEEEKDFISLRFPFLSIKNILFPNVTKQPDTYSCGAYACAFATGRALGQDPSLVNFSRNASIMRKHLMKILEARRLFPFPIAGNNRN